MNMDMPPKVKKEELLDNKQESAIQIFIKTDNEQSLFLGDLDDNLLFETSIKAIYDKDNPLFKEITKEDKAKLEKNAQHILEFFNTTGGYNLEMAKTSIQYLNIENEEGFKKTKDFLYIVKDFISNNTKQDEHDESNYPDFQKFKIEFEKKLDNPENNYFYNLYCKSLLGEDRTILINKENSQSIKPFEIGQDICVANEGDALFLFDKKDFEEMKKSSKLEHDLIIQYSKGKINSNDFYIGNKSMNKKDWKDFLEEYEFIMNTGVKMGIENDFGIKLNDLSIPEQFNFLNFIKHRNLQEIKEVQNFSKKFDKNINAFRAFLSIEQGGKEMGDKILTLGEKLPKESAGLLFSKYGEIINAVDSIETLLKEALGDKATPEVLESAKERLLLQGKDLLEEYATSANTCKDKECEDLGIELNERLSLAKESVFAFSSACRTLVDMGNFSFEDFKKAELIYDKSPLPEEIKNEIIAMHKENTKQYPDKLREYWRGTLKDGLEKENEKQMVVSVKYEDTVVSTMRVIEQEDGSWYGASFNVNPLVMGSRIGTELLKEVINNLAKDKPFVADCYSENPMLKTYVEKFNFKITDTFEDYENTGAKVYRITLYPDSAKENQK